MRIIAGKFKGRKLKAPEGQDIRPTGDRVRESIFNLLMHGQYGGLDIFDQHVADLCCGTGALGLEALSRGARAVTFVDADKRALALAQENAIHCGAVQHCFFVACDVARLPVAREPAALILMDAPYAKPLLPVAYAALRAQHWLQQHTLIVSESSRDVAPPALDGATLIDTRHYGKAQIAIYRCD